MPRTAQKVDALAAEGDDMTEALAAVLDVAETEGAVAWSDVSDDISSGQWGRLIETGLLVDADGEGFVIDDPEGVREALEETDPDAVADGEEPEVNWTQWDKLAAVGTLGMFAGYQITSIRNVVAGVVDVVLGQLVGVVPFYVIVLLLAVVTGLFSSVVRDALTDSEVMGKYQSQMQDLKDRREAAKERGDDEALEQIQQEQMEAMGDQLGMFKAQFRPMVWIMLLTIPAFLWMYWMIRDGHIDSSGLAMVLPLIGEVTDWQQRIFGVMPIWIVWYFLCSLGFTQIIMKALNVQTSPTG